MVKVDNVVAYVEYIYIYIYIHIPEQHKSAERGSCPR
jgi:hypothetical protein